MRPELIGELDRAHLEFDAAMNRFLAEAQAFSAFVEDYEQLVARHAETRAAAVAFVMEAAMLRNDIANGRKSHEILVSMT